MQSRRAPIKTLAPAIFFILFLFCSFVSSEETYKFERMWPSLQQPWYFCLPYGITVDHKGYVYVADTMNDQIQKFTSDGQFVVKWKGGANEEDGFWGTYDVDADRNGFMYVTDTFRDRIQKFNSNGLFIKKWGTSGSNNAEFMHPQSLSVDNRGFLYVADTDNHRIQKFTLDGKYIDQWGNQGSEDGQFQYPCGIDVDSNGIVYVTDQKNHRIQKFTPDGKFEGKWGSKGDEDGKFDHPQDLVIDDKGFVYVCDLFNQRIQKFTLDGGFITKWGSECGSPSARDGEFSGPFGIAIDEKGFVYVADAENHRIQKFTSDGQFITKWSTVGSGDGEFNQPRGITIDSSGCVYIADIYNYRIQKFTPQGEYVTQFGKYGYEEGEFDEPEDVAVDKKGFIYVVDKINRRIQKFTPDWKFTDQWGSEGDGDNEFSLPTDIAIDDNGFVYVVDQGNQRVQKFDPNGVFEAKWGEKGCIEEGETEAGSGEFCEPHGIAIDINGNVYVSDSCNTCIQKFDTDGNFIAKWGNFDIFQNPTGVAVDNNGLVYVTDEWYPRVQIFDPNGQLIATVGEQGAGPEKLNSPHDLFISPDGKIYVTNSANHSVVVFSKVIPTQKQPRAIIVAGGGPYPGNNLWDATRMCANFAYRTLTYQGFTKENIFYLSADTSLDLDDNGLLDDVDWDISSNNLHQAVMECADANSTSDVVIYLVDHGGRDTFRIAGSEILSSSDLETWLDALQETISGKVTVIYDACESGSFISALTPSPDKERIVITSTSPGERAHFITAGSISFSYFFFNHIFNEGNVKNAFDLASEAISMSIEYQNPLLNDNGNSTGNDPFDGILAQQTYLGLGVNIQGNAPLIGEVSSDRIGTHSARLYADGVSDDNGIARVWAVIRPPNFDYGSSTNPLMNLPSVDLLPADQNQIMAGHHQYETIYNELYAEGTYHIAIYARDRRGNTAIPKLTSIQVEDPLKHRAVIVAGGPLYSSLWPSIENIASLVYNALIFQGYTDEEILLFSPRFFCNGVDDVPTLNNLHYALANWASQNTQDLMLYIIGNGNSESFQINGGETLTAAVLDTWLDELQDTISGVVTVIYDASSSGSFLPQLTPPINKERIMISSTGPNDPAYFLSNGDISFSGFFWRQIINGANIRDAFVHAINAIGCVCPAQEPRLDDNGNGIGNEMGKDGRVAAERRLGARIILADDPPLIAAVSPEQSLVYETSATIWADEVTTTGVIEKVWAYITPPAKTFVLAPTPLTELPILEMVRTGEGRYEATYGSFSLFGTYRIAVYAKDKRGNISLPKETLIHKCTGPDLYEEDDAPDQAELIILSPNLSQSYPQRHNFHDLSDQDWVQFYGLAGQKYDIKINNAESNCDAVITLYDTDGATILEGPLSWWEYGGDEFLSLECPQDGTYYVMVRQFDSSIFGENTGYDLTIFYPVGPGAAFISGRVCDSQTPSLPIVGAEIENNFGGSAKSQANGMYVIDHPEVPPDEPVLLTAWASGYKEKVLTVKVSEFDKTICNFFLEPEDDKDGDKYQDNIDAFPLDPNEWLDTDEDKIGNNADQDDDNDGLSDIFEEQFSFTDPLNTDTDGNGTPDGLEDMDLDGFDNIKESSMDTYPQKPDVFFSPGLNLFGYPTEVHHGYTSYDLLKDIGTEEEIIKIQRYDPSTQSYKSTIYNNGKASGDTFNIADGEGYLIYMKEAKIVSFSGLLAHHSVLLKEGLNIVSLLPPHPGYTSYDLLSSLGFPDEIKGLTRLNKDTSLYETTTYHFGRPCGYCFPLVNGEAYLIHLKGIESLLIE